MLASALEHYRRQQRITALGLIAARRVSGSPARVAVILAAFQLAAAEDAAAAVPLMLAEQGIDATAEGSVNTAALTGIASDGRPLQSLIEQADTASAFDLIVTTQLQDMARISGSLGGVSRPAVSGYVRMLNTPSCSRCVVLAGKFYRYNTGFLRHPKCDCRHVPSDEDRAGDLRTDPRAYFDSIDKAEQDRIFTKAGAQAIRDGADISQVVNARRGARGLSPAGGRFTKAEQKILQGGKDRGALERVDVYGHQVFITSEGITRRGIAGRRLGAAENGERLKGSRYASARAPRLMPESIYEIAGADRDEAIRLLKLHGYLL